MKNSNQAPTHMYHRICQQTCQHTATNSMQAAVSWTM
jgi:hypothetical protein